MIGKTSAGSGAGDISSTRGIAGVIEAGRLGATERARRLLLLDLKSSFSSRPVKLIRVIQGIWEIQSECPELAVPIAYQKRQIEA
jgi:hypothetical protein